MSGGCTTDSYITLHHWQHMLLLYRYQVVLLVVFEKHESGMYSVICTLTNCHAEMVCIYAHGYSSVLDLPASQWEV